MQIYESFFLIVVHFLQFFFVSFKKGRIFAVLKSVFTMSKKQVNQSFRGVPMSVKRGAVLKIDRKQHPYFSKFQHYAF